MSYTILVTAPELAPAGQQLLDERGCRTLTLADIGDTAALRHCLASQPIDAIISRTMMLDEAMIASCPGLRAISKHGVGVSNIDLQSAKRHDIAVYATPGANSQSVVEFTLALMLATARRLPRFDASVRAGQWQRSSDGIQLAGRTLGLVGFGQIGRGVARLAQALQMKVLVLDPYFPAEEAQAMGVTLVPTLAALLPHCDLLSLHCPAERGAPPLLGAEQFAQLPKGAILINTARGELVDEAALASALESGQLAGAGLDSFAVEPLPLTSPLRQLKPLILTPHVGGSTPDALALMASRAATNVLNHLDGLHGLATTDCHLANRVC